MAGAFSNCPQCNYSAEPDEVIGQERKHFFPHSLRCVRCGYTTETKATMLSAAMAWNSRVGRGSPLGRSQRR